MNTLDGSFCLHKKTMEGSREAALPNRGGGLGGERSSPHFLQNMEEDLTANLVMGCLGIALALQKARGLVWRRNPPHLQKHGGGSELVSCYTPLIRSCGIVRAIYLPAYSRGFQALGVVSAQSRAVGF